MGVVVHKRPNLVQNVFETHHIGSASRPREQPPPACSGAREPYLCWRVCWGGLPAQICLVERTPLLIRLHMQAVRLALRAGGMCNPVHPRRWTRSPNGRRRLLRRREHWRSNGERESHRAALCQHWAATIRQIASRPACHQTCPATYPTLRTAAPPTAWPTRPGGSNSAGTERVMIGTLAHVTEEAI